MSKLPDGWKEVELGDVLDYEQPTKYIVESDQYNDKYKTPVLTAGKSFLLGHTNETKGVYTNLPVIIFDDFTIASKFVTFPFKVKSSAMKLLTPKTKEINLKYIFLLMQTIKLDSTTHKRYYLSKYQHIKIALPPLETQNKIISFLEKAEKSKEWRKEADELTKAFLKSVFNEMFGNYLRNKESHKKIMCFCPSEKNAIKAGPFGSSLKKEFYVDKGYKIYGQEQVIKNDFVYGDYYIDEERYKKLENCKIKSGDILISLVGSYGHISIVPEKFEQGIINPRLMKITLDKSKMNPIFFRSLFLSSFVKNKLKSVSHGGTMDIINVGLIKNIDFPEVPIELQNKFASIVKEVEAMKENQRQSGNKIDDLFNTLMQKAFKGDLVV